MVYALYMIYASVRENAVRTFPNMSDKAILDHKKSY